MYPDELDDANGINNGLARVDRCTPIEWYHGRTTMVMLHRTSVVSVDTTHQFT